MVLVFHSFSPVLDRCYVGQSARAGETTFYARLDISEEVLQVIGGWSSAAWKIYICELCAIRVEQQLAAIQCYRGLTSIFQVPRISFS